MAARYQKEIGRYKIKVSSTEVIDGILDEARVMLCKRHLVLKAICSIENKQWRDVRKQLV